MFQRLKVRSLQPPGGFRARCPHCGFWLVATAWNDWVPEIEKHNKANGHEPWDYEDALCRMLPPGSCLYENGSAPDGWDCRSDLLDLAKGAASLAHLAFDKFFGEDIFVDQAEAERRASICAVCPANVMSSGCIGCTAGEAAKAATDMIVKEKHTSSDQHLHACCVCQCSTRALAWIRGENIKRGITDRQMRAYQELYGHCWKNELIAGNENSKRLAAQASSE